jgi:hypothetical protein
MGQGPAAYFGNARETTLPRRIEGRRSIMGMRQYRQPNRLGGSTGSQTRKHARAVHLDRPSTNAEIVGDLLGEASNDQLVKHLAFARAQPRNPLGGLHAFPIMDWGRLHRHCLVDCVEKLFVVEGFFDEIDRPTLHCPNRGLHVAFQRHHDDRELEAN